MHNKRGDEQNRKGSGMDERSARLEVPETRCVLLAFALFLLPHALWPFHLVIICVAYIIIRVSLHGINILKEDRVKRERVASEKMLRHNIPGRHPS